MGKLLGRNKLLFTALVISLTVIPLCGYCLPTKGRVLDKANILSPNEIVQLESQLADYDARTSVEIVLITTRDLEGLDLNEYATKLGNSLKLGKKDLNNGVVILVVPSEMPPFTLPAEANQDLNDPFTSLVSQLENDTSSDSASLSNALRSIYIQGKSLARDSSFQERPSGFYGAGYIAPGYGIESALPDIVCRRIMIDGVRPYIMAHRNGDACRIAVAMTIAELDSQYSMGNQEWAQENTSEDSEFSLRDKIILFLIFGFPILLSLLSFSKGPVGGISRAILLALLSSGGSSRSSGSSGGFGGGSFSGGGGSFGGGGGGGNF